MLFNSIDFLLFLPTVFCLYWLLHNNHKWQNLFVVIASYVFYGLWDWKFLFLIAFTSACSYATAILIEKMMDSGCFHKAKIVCITNVVINLLILGIFKYYNFFIESLEEILNLIGVNAHLATLQLVLPVGISFYTFQALSYSIDVYNRRLPASHDIVSFFAFISFFPQLVAGPIERATNLLPQFTTRRVFNYETAVDGMRLILWGLFKKIVIADNCAEYVDMVFSNQEAYSGSVLALAGFFFAFQIYGDFSGYSDIAIGTAKLFGIYLKDNFRTPYFSRTIAEFWKRWHISLNKWFVDYVYIPLGGSRTKNVLIVRNVLVIFLLSGLWHGANWTFVIWGLYHALLFIPLILTGRNKDNKDIVASNSVFPCTKDFIHILLTFVLVTVGWIIFRSDNISMAYNILHKIVDFPSWKWPIIVMTYKAPTIFAILMCIVLEWINRKRRHSFDLSWVKYPWIRVTLYYIVLSMIILYSGKNVTFI